MKQQRFKFILSLAIFAGLYGGSFLVAQQPQVMIFGNYQGRGIPVKVGSDGALGISATINGADGAIVDGVDANIKATVFDLTNSNPSAVQIVDGTGTAITSFGGGTQYTQDAALTVATSIGTMAMGRASAAAPTDVSANNDAVMPWYLRSGAEAVQVTFGGILATTGAGNVGTGVQLVTLATDQAAMVGFGVYVEDAAETAGGNLVMAGSVRRDTAAASAGSSGDNATINTDSLGRLWIAGVYLEDAASASGDSGMMILTRRTDSVAASAGTDGDYQTLNTDASGRLWINCSTGCSGGTQYTEDAASAGGETLTLAGAVRQNTLASSTSTDGDYAYLKVDSVGALYVNPMGATQAAGTYLTVRLSDGTSFLSPSSDQTEDAASAGGETGPMVLSVRRDAAASSAGTTGDFATFNTDANGLQWTRNMSPCSALAHTQVSISVAADTAVISASASNRNYICSGMIFANTAEVIDIWEGTGSACGTSSAAIIGSTTEANGISLTANQGFIIPQPIRGLSTNVDTCIRIVGTSRVAGYFDVVQAP